MLLYFKRRTADGARVRARLKMLSLLCISTPTCMCGRVLMLADPPSYTAVLTIQSTCSSFSPPPLSLSLPRFKHPFIDRIFILRASDPPPLLPFYALAKPDRSFMHSAGTCHHFQTLKLRPELSVGRIGPAPSPFRFQSRIYITKVLGCIFFMNTK